MARALLALLCCSTFTLACLGCGKGGDASSKAHLDSTGVDACDAYVAKMLACAGKLPAEARPAHEAAIQTARDLLEAKADADDAALKGSAEADARVALEATCKQMSDALAERAVCN
jgi:hypothetical protein